MWIIWIVRAQYLRWVLFELVSRFRAPSQGIWSISGDLSYSLQSKCFLGAGRFFWLRNQDGSSLINGLWCYLSWALVLRERIGSPSHVGTGMQIWPSYILIAANFIACYKYEVFAAGLIFGPDVKIFCYIISCCAAALKLLYVMYVATVYTIVQLWLKRLKCYIHALDLWILFFDDALRKRRVAGSLLLCPVAEVDIPTTNPSA